MYVQLRLDPPFRSGIYLGNLFGALLFLSVGVSFAVWALVSGRPKSEEEMTWETAKVKGKAFPRGYTANAIVAFAGGLALLIFAVAWLVWTAALMPISGTAVVAVFVLAFPLLGFGGFLASWALIEGRRSQEGIT